MAQCCDPKPEGEAGVCGPKCSCLMLKKFAEIDKRLELVEKGLSLVDKDLTLLEKRSR
jgi:hypothetical protein